jgi:Tfp pilus assembly protein PilV
MTNRLRQRIRDERGIALMVALAATLVLGIAVTSLIMYTTSNQSAANLNKTEQSAQQIAEAGMQQAYSVLRYANANGTNPSAPPLLGCVTDGTDGTKSNCQGQQGTAFCITASSGCSRQTSGEATVWGCYTGTANASCTMPDGSAWTTAKSTWNIWSTGYVRSSTGSGLIAHTVKATVLLKPIDSGAVAAVWNHVFVTAPATASTCQLDLQGNGTTTLNVPVYVIGNLCLGTAVVSEVAGGQAVDLQVGGKLYMTSGTVGANSSTPITSGVVVGGCTTQGLSYTVSPCAGSNPAYSYWVRTLDTWIPNDAPAETTDDMNSDWSKFDPGPLLTCQTGTTPSPPTTPLDNETTGHGTLASEPDDSNTTTFDLTPGSSYACISKKGTSTGYLIWNNGGTTITVSGVSVPPQTLAVNGSIFIDGNVTASNSATYNGTAIVEMAGTFSMSGNNHWLCATTSCNFNSWQGSSGNNSMLTIASLAVNNSSAISFTGNHESFQGSLWTQPSSGLNTGSNSVSLQGPISIGTFASSMNNLSIQALPVIKNMPVGAPIPPNMGAVIGTLSYTSS